MTHKITLLPIIFLTALFNLNAQSQFTTSPDFPDKEYLIKQIGDTFTYHHIIDYSDDEICPPPFPWSDGRIRDGKYKASKKAMNDYIESFKAQSGKKFKMVKYVCDEKLGRMDVNQGFVFVDEKGDSILCKLYSSYFSIEFINDKQISELNKLIGKTVINLPPFCTYRMGLPDAVLMLNYLYDENTKNIAPAPALAEWEVTKITIDESYYGNHTQENNTYNMFPRVRIHLFNKLYGMYSVPIHLFEKCFFQKDRINEYRIVRLQNGADYIFTDNDISLIKEWASKGDPAAMFTQWNYIDESEKMNELLSAAIKREHIGAMIAAISYPVRGVEVNDEILRIANKLYNKGFRSNDLREIYENRANHLKLKASTIVLNATNENEKKEAVKCYLEALDWLNRAKEVVNETPFAEEFVKTKEMIIESIESKINNVNSTLSRLRTGNSQ